MLFQQIANYAKLRKRDFKPADKVPRTYSREKFNLHGRMDLDISFRGKTKCTPVYIKMDAVEPLLLSEGVCSQLGLITFHPDVLGETRKSCQSVVPRVSVQLVRSVKLLPQRSYQVPVSLTGAELNQKLTMIEPDPRLLASGVVPETVLLEPQEKQPMLVPVTNPTGFTVELAQQTVVGALCEVEVVPQPEETAVAVQLVQAGEPNGETWRKGSG